MRRRICWFEREEDGVKREVEAHVAAGPGVVEWKIWREEADGRRRSNTPTPADWDELCRRADAWYRRGALPYEELLIIQKRGVNDLTGA